MAEVAARSSGVMCTRACWVGRTEAGPVRAGQLAEPCEVTGANRAAVEARGYGRHLRYQPGRLLKDEGHDRPSMNMGYSAWAAHRSAVPALARTASNGRPTAAVQGRARLPSDPGLRLTAARTWPGT